MKVLIETLFRFGPSYRNSFLYKVLEKVHKSRENFLTPIAAFTKHWTLVLCQLKATNLYSIQGY